MLEVEGGEYEWCMRILGTRPVMPSTTHSNCAAAGSGSTRSDRPASRIRVLHAQALQQELRAASRFVCAQSHPDEDFAETFAVWLTPNSEWRQRYAGWRALGKLEYMDSLMDSLRGGAAGQNPEEIDPLSSLRTTLRHYRNKRRYYGVDYPNFYDRDLRRLFSDAPEFADASAPRSSSIASGARSGASSRAGPASTMPRSIRCSRT